MYFKDQTIDEFDNEDKKTVAFKPSDFSEQDQKLQNQCQREETPKDGSY